MKKKKNEYYTLSMTFKNMSEAQRVLSIIGMLAPYGTPEYKLWQIKKGSL